MEPAKVEAQLQRKAELHAEIVLLEQDIDQLKGQRKATKRHIELSELPEDQRFRGLSGGGKQLLDTVKMIASRAETAMAPIGREESVREEAARSILRAGYDTGADLLPDRENMVLRVRLHDQANKRANKVVSRLCQELNGTETEFPGTDLKVVYELVSCPKGDGGAGADDLEALPP